MHTRLGCSLFLIVTLSTHITCIYITDKTPIHDYVVEGDLLIGVILPMNWDRAGRYPTCEGQFLHFAIQYAQSALFTMETVNNDSRLLPNTSLGMVLLYDCKHYYIGFDRSAQFIPVSDFVKDNCNTSSRNLGNKLIVITKSIFNIFLQVFYCITNYIILIEHCVSE